MSRRTRMYLTDAPAHVVQRGNNQTPVSSPRMMIGFTATVWVVACAIAIWLYAS